MADAKRQPILRYTLAVQRAEKIAYNLDQYQRAYEFAKGHKNGLSIMIMLETGISRSELLGLTWDDFDCKNASTYPARASVLQ